jgi:hypothetical protein
MVPGNLKITSGRGFYIDISTEHVQRASLNVDIWSENKEYQRNINAMVNEWHLRFNIPQYTITASVRRPAANLLWIVGDWYSEGDAFDWGSDITFNADGSFDFGSEDCRTEGTYTIQGDTIHLNGISDCYECDDCKTEYQKTLPLTEKLLEGYKKFQ